MEQNKNDNQVQQPESSAMSTGGFFCLGFAKILVIALVIIVPLECLLPNLLWFPVPMQPNFHNYDYLIIDRFSYIKAAAKRML